ncbi:hypothetical protein FI667_g3293, partial [Globisporangium splendens]
MQLDAENEAALQALRGPGPLAATQGLRLRGFVTCPHCHQGFGSASFAIHVRRCRALYPPPEEESVGGNENAASAKPAKPVKPKKPKPLYSLVDLCLRFITKNFQTVCMDRIASQPEEEAALIESLPTSLVHRIIVNLLDEKDAKQRAKIKRMETDAAALQRENQRLETFRQQTMTARARLNEQEQASEQLRRELEARTQELAAQCARSQQLRSQSEGLSSENDTLKTELKAAQKKEMDAIKQLATASKKLGVRAARSTTPASSSTANSTSATSAATRRPERTRPSDSTSTHDIGAGVKRLKVVGSQQSSCGRAQQPVLLHRRPHSNDSRIPFPASLSENYLARLRCV